MTDTYDRLTGALRGTLIGAITKKLLSLPEFEASQVATISLITVDIEQASQVFFIFQTLWGSALEATLCFICLRHYLGGTVFIVASLPLCRFNHARNCFDANLAFHQCLCQYANILLPSLLIFK